MTPAAATLASGGAVPQGPRGSRRLLARALIVGIAPVVAYGAVRPFVGSDTLGLAIAGAIPMIYGVTLAAARRRIDLLALLASIGYALGCLLSLLLGGSSLPLKLHEAFITFTVGLVLLVAVALGRPIPLGHLFRQACPQRDASLGVMIGGFLVLHALLHVALAVTLSTTSYVVVSRVVNWTTIAVGAFCLSAYLRSGAEATRAWRSRQTEGPRLEQ